MTAANERHIIGRNNRYGKKRVFMYCEKKKCIVN